MYKRPQFPSHLPYYMSRNAESRGRRQVQILLQPYISSDDEGRLLVVTVDSGEDGSSCNVVGPGLCEDPIRAQPIYCLITIQNEMPLTKMAVHLSFPDSLSFAVPHGRPLLVVGIA
jgi:hypothetical protein